MSAPWKHPLEHISLSQALWVWGQLVEALHGVNVYGGNVAEIYVYRLLTPHARKAIEENYADATASLQILVEMFIRDFDCVVAVDPPLHHPLSPEDPPRPARHRWRITVTKDPP